MKKVPELKLKVYFFINWMEISTESLDFIRITGAKRQK
jgi:hypothetical protein